MSGFLFNDVLALVSVIGCSLMFLGEVFGAPLHRLGKLGEWGTAPLVFGMLFQIALNGIGLTDQNIGFIFPMPPNLVSGLFALSFLLLLGRGWLRRPADH